MMTGQPNEAPGNWIDRIDHYRFLLVVLLAMMLPFDVSFSYIVIPALSIVLLFISDNFNLKNTIGHISKRGYLVTSIFLIHAIWFLLIISRTWSTGYLEKMLPMLLFPLMIFSTRIDGRRSEIISKGFIATVIASYVLSVVAAVYHYYFSVARWGRPSDFFFHEQFTAGLFDIHPTYYALMGCLATVLAFRLLPPGQRIAAVLLLTVGILLINARITFVIQMLVITFYVVKGFIQGFTFVKVVIVATMAVGLFFTLKAFNSIYDYPHRKLAVNLETAWQRSFAPDISDGDGGIILRMAIWRNAIKLFKEHPLLGVGLGYEEDYLVEEYKAEHQPHLYESHFNAHNQALSYLIGMGIVGFAMLTVVYGMFIWDAFQKRHWQYFEFLGIFFIVCLTESVLNRLLGVSIFAFFNAMLVMKFDNTDD